MFFLKKFKDEAELNEWFFESINKLDEDFFLQFLKNKNIFFDRKTLYSKKLKELIKKYNSYYYDLIIYEMKKEKQNKRKKLLKEKKDKLKRNILKKINLIKNSIKKKLFLLKYNILFSDLFNNKFFKELIIIFLK